MQLKKVFSALLIVLMCSSCKNTWSDEDKKMLYDSFMENAMTWAGSKEKAKAYSDCVVEKIMLKYPNEAEALAHMDSIMRDADLKKCKSDILSP
jgi:hypothetical protein